MHGPKQRCSRVRHQCQRRLARRRGRQWTPARDAAAAPVGAAADSGDQIGDGRAVQRRAPPRRPAGVPASPARRWPTAPTRCGTAPRRSTQAATRSGTRAATSDQTRSTPASSHPRSRRTWATRTAQRRTRPEHQVLERLRRPGDAAGDAIEALRPNHRSRPRSSAKIHGETPPPPATQERRRPAQHDHAAGDHDLPTSHRSTPEHRRLGLHVTTTPTTTDTGTDDTGGTMTRTTTDSTTPADDDPGEVDPGDPPGPARPATTLPAARARHDRRHGRRSRCRRWCRRRGRRCPRWWPRPGSPED